MAAHCFSVALELACGDRVRASEQATRDVWCATTNQEWRCGEQVYDYTFREAGHVIAEMRGKGDYIDWYCSGEPGVVADWIAEAMAREGWVPVPPES